MIPNRTPSFSVQETHGILWQPTNDVHVSSDGHGWTSIYASAQREAPYEARFSAVKDHLIILHRDGPVGVSRALGRSHTRRVIGPGGLFVLPGGLEFGVTLEGHLESLHLYLRQNVVEEVANDFGVNDSETQLVAQIGVRDPLIEQLALSVHEAMTSCDPHAALYVDYLARVLAAHLLRRHSSSSKTVTTSIDGTRARVARAIDFMESNLSEPLTLADMAKVAASSPNHFAQCFKQITGAPPHQYLMQMRVERAKRLLVEREPIAEIALACGFTHQEHLTRIFRRVTGVTPASYRKAALS